MAEDHQRNPATVLREVFEAAIPPEWRVPGWQDVIAEVERHCDEPVERPKAR